MPPASTIGILLGLLVSLAAAAKDPAERETLLRVMEAVSSDRDWRSDAGADPCGSPWPGLECKPAAQGRMHVARLDFGVPPNPTCKDTAAFPVGAFALPELRGLFLVDCFKNPDAITAFTLPPASNLSSSPLRQLSVRANPSLSGTLPQQLASLRSLQVLTVSQNALIRGEVPQSIGALKNLVHLDLTVQAARQWLPAPRAACSRNTRSGLKRLPASRRFRLAGSHKPPLWTAGAGAPRFGYALDRIVHHFVLSFQIVTGKAATLKMHVKLVPRLSVMATYRASD